MHIINLVELKEHILACYPMEACGVVIQNKFIPVENVHIDPINNFSFSQKDCLKFSDVDAIIHSHTMEIFQEDPRTPSYSDMISMRNTDTVWGILHCDGENVTDILWANPIEVPELLGRDYISNVLDCFTLARDYYRKNYNVDLGLHPRPANWEEWNPNYIEQNFISCGFEVKPFSKIIQPSDILLININSDIANHIGVVVGQDTFIHHLYKRKSNSDTIGKWKRYIKQILTYTGNIDA